MDLGLLHYYSYLILMCHHYYLIMSVAQMHLLSWIGMDLNIKNETILDANSSLH